MSEYYRNSTSLASMPHAMLSHELELRFKNSCLIAFDVQTFRHLLQPKRRQSYLQPRSYTHTQQPIPYQHAIRHQGTRSPPIMNSLRRFSTSVAKLLTWGIKGTTEDVSEAAVIVEHAIKQSEPHRPLLDKFTVATVKFVAFPSKPLLPLERTDYCNTTGVIRM